MGEKMEHLNKIVEQILGFARTSEPNLSPVNVNQILDDLSLLIRHKLRNQQVHFVRAFDPQLPTVPADATQVEQAFLNVILNAVEAMPGGGTLTVSTRIIGAESGNIAPGVEIEFKDTGSGMSQEQRSSAFNSLLSTTKANGTGLGLAIVRRIVEVHRGQLNIRSQPGKGTTISIRLPTQ